jgi:hypothetical protein
MPIYITLRGLTDPVAGERVYERGMNTSADTLQTYVGQELVGTIGWHILQVDGILYSVKQGAPTDKLNRKIGLRKQFTDLESFIIATKKFETLIRTVLASDGGRARWNNGIVALRDRIASIEEECDQLQLCAERIETVKAEVRIRIEKENAERITDTLNPFLVSTLIIIIGQYMD